MHSYLRRPSASTCEEDSKESDDNHVTVLKQQQRPGKRKETAMMATRREIKPGSEGDKFHWVQGAWDSNDSLPQRSTEGQAKESQERDDTAEHSVL